MSRLDPEDLLRRVLELERQQSFGNRAMAGGLSAFARTLHSRADAASRVPEAALLLADYDADDPINRKQAIESSLTVLNAPRESPASSPQPAPTGATERDGATGVPPKSGKLPSTSSGKPAQRAKGAKQTVAKPSPAASIRSTGDVLPQALESLSGVGQKRAEQLAQFGFRTVGDLLYYFPREHLDYRRRDHIRSLRVAERTTILAEVESVRLKRIRKNLSITTVRLRDDSGRVDVEWFNQPYLEKTFRVGRKVAISGELGFSGDWRVFRPRDYEFVDDEELTHAARLVPIYPLRKGLHQKSLRTLIHEACQHAAPRVRELLPDYLLDTFHLPALGSALAGFHFPDSEKECHEARRRLVFDEMLAVQLGLRRRKQEWRDGEPAPAIQLSDTDRQTFLSMLPFTPTGAQSRVMADVETSIASTKPMSRLIQGDVGSGKTAVAALGLYASARAGYQSVLMAPTEILAQQHFTSLTAWLEPLGVRCGLLLGSTTAKQRREILAAAETRQLDVLIGTHALFQEGVDLNNLGLAVVDEQHRFGVEQRSKLRHKGRAPHLLAMTATPIPRTLQLTLYGDLDISIIDELPPGRIPIQTKLYTQAHHAYRLVEQEIQKGRQAFVVCPVIDESLDEDMKSAVAEHKRLQETVFPTLRIGLLHGRMRPKEKDETLVAFRDRQYDILVATSVVEVGIDVPNATVMVIRDAHRFGLAQLHQLRGRVGRGGDQSYCALISPVTEGPTLERLQVVETSQDGFRLAEKDLELRGPGDFWGTRQSGLPELRLAGPGDIPILEMAQKAADMVVDRDPKLDSHVHKGLRAMVDRFWSTPLELH